MANNCRDLVVQTRGPRHNIWADRDAYRDWSTPHRPWRSDIRRDSQHQDNCNGRRLYTAPANPNNRVYNEAFDYRNQRSGGFGPRRQYYNNCRNDGRQALDSQVEEGYDNDDLALSRTPCGSYQRKQFNYGNWRRPSSCNRTDYMYPRLDYGRHTYRDLRGDYLRSSYPGAGHWRDSNRFNLIDCPRPYNNRDDSDCLSRYHNRHSSANHCRRDFPGDDNYVGHVHPASWRRRWSLAPTWSRSRRFCGPEDITHCPPPDHRRLLHHSYLGGYHGSDPNMPFASRNYPMQSFRSNPPDSGRCRSTSYQRNCPTFPPVSPPWGINADNICEDRLPPWPRRPRTLYLEGPDPCSAQIP